MTATRVSNYGGNDLLTCILELAGNARQRLWIKIPWWDNSKSAKAILDAVLAARRRGVDVLVLCRPEASNDAVLRTLRANDVMVVPIRYIHEKEVVADGVLVAHSMNFTRMEIERNQNSGFVHDETEVVDAAVDGFEQLRSNAAAIQVGDEAWTQASRLLPEHWLEYIDRPRLNPLQSKAVPAVLSTDGHVMVVAPTSSGKTLVGEVAALRSILEEGKTAVWLLPARALAAEVAETAERWRKHGIRSVQLTGEVNLSSASIRQAQLWVATTEKFESLYRRSSLRDHIGNIGCLIIDEVHLVGDESRGATLESLIARLRQAQERTRIVALSATVSNAEEVAAWFKADLIRTDWRPTVLTTQLVPYKVASDARWGEKEAAKNRAIRPLLADLRENSEDPATVLIFCGSKKGVQSVAVAAAGVAPSGSLESDVESCFEAGVGMHFRDAPRAQRALEGFRSRKTPILVATSGLSTGVNTPARAVIIRDLQLGITPLEVSQAQQMLGRAGRAGQEEVGFGFILVPEDELSSWRLRLSEGYTVKSHIIDNIADAVLAEILLGIVTSRESADSWFEETFAYSLGATDARLAEEIDCLVLNGFVTEANNVLSITSIGLLTSRLMVDVASAAALLSAIAQAPVPTSAEHAERLLIGLVASSATPLVKYPVNENSAGGAVGTILSDWAPAHLKRMTAFGSQFCAAAAELALYNTQTLRSKPTQDMPLGDLRRAVEDLPRYFAWVAALGYADTQSWIPAVAADLTRRLTWWHLGPQPERGNGRLLWLLEKVLEPQNQRTKMQGLWTNARRADICSPEQMDTLPANADASPEKFRQILQGRADLSIEKTTAEGSAVQMTVVSLSPTNRLTARTHRGLQPAITTTASVETGVRLELPPGDPRVADVAVDAFLYTSDGDWAYDNTICKSVGAAHGQDPLESARAAVQLLSPTFVVSNPKKWRSALRSKHKRTAERIASLIAPTPGFLDIAQALSAHDPDPTRSAWFLADRLPQLLEARQGAGEPRHPASVLISGYASSSELKYCLSALMRSLNLEAGIALSADGEPVPLVELDTVWHVVGAQATQHGALKAIYPEELPTVISTLGPPPVQEVVSITPVLSWIHEFAGNGAAHAHGEDRREPVDTSNKHEAVDEMDPETSDGPMPAASATDRPDPLEPDNSGLGLIVTPDVSDYLAEQRKVHTKAYALWAPKDDRRLLQLSEEGWTVPDLMREFQRNDGSIRSRLKKLTEGRWPEPQSTAASGSARHATAGADPEPPAQHLVSADREAPPTQVRRWAVWGDSSAPLLPAAVRYLSSARVSPLNLLDVQPDGPTPLGDLDGTTARPVGKHWSTDSKNQAIKAFQVIVNDWSYPHLLKQHVVDLSLSESLPELDIDDLRLSVRATNCLDSAGVRDTFDLAEFTWEELLDIRQLGHKSLVEILCTVESLLTAAGVIDLAQERERHRQISPVRGHWAGSQSTGSGPPSDAEPGIYDASGVWLKQSKSYQAAHDLLQAQYGLESFAVELSADFATSGKYSGQTYLRATVAGDEVGVLPTRYRKQCPDFFRRAEIDTITVSGRIVWTPSGDRLVRVSEEHSTSHAVSP